MSEKGFDNGEEAFDAVQDSTDAVEVETETDEELWENHELFRVLQVLISRSAYTLKEIVEQSGVDREIVEHYHQALREGDYLKRSPEGKIQLNEEGLMEFGLLLGIYERHQMQQRFEPTQNNPIYAYDPEAFETQQYNENEYESKYGQKTGELEISEQVTAHVYENGVVYVYQEGPRAGEVYFHKPLEKKTQQTFLDLKKFLLRSIISYWDS